MKDSLINLKESIEGCDNPFITSDFKERQKVDEIESVLRYMGYFMIAIHWGSKTEQDSPQEKKYTNVVKSLMRLLYFYTSPQTISFIENADDYSKYYEPLYGLAHYAEKIEHALNTRDKELNPLDYLSEEEWFTMLEEDNTKEEEI